MYVSEGFLGYYFYHFLVILECGVGRRGRIPFRFENMWLQAEGFME